MLSWSLIILFCDQRIFIDSLEQAESIEMWEKTVNGAARQLQACRWVILRSMDNSNYLGNMATAGSLALSNIEKVRKMH